MAVKKKYHPKYVYKTDGNGNTIEVPNEMYGMKNPMSHLKPKRKKRK